MRHHFATENPGVALSQAALRQWLDTMTQGDRIDTVMGFSSTMRAVLNWGDTYLPHYTNPDPPEASRG